MSKDKKFDFLRSVNIKMIYSFRKAKVNLETMARSSFDENSCGVCSKLQTGKIFRTL